MMAIEQKIWLRCYKQRSPWWIHDIDESCKFWDARVKSYDN
jgi:hypothetical protein